MRMQREEKRPGAVLLALAQDGAFWSSAAAGHRNFWKAVKVHEFLLYLFKPSISESYCLANVPKQGPVEKREKEINCQV